VLFNSFTFVLFLAVVLPAYYVLSHRWQNRMLLVASYVFYGAWDWRFLSLLATSTVVDYVVSHAIHRSADARARRRLLLVSICVNLGFLGFFKYFGFFVESFNGLLGACGLAELSWGVRIILPVGISFYTFQALAYTVDVYRGKVAPPRSLFDFALFVSYFPQLVAGPIERAGNLMPAILNKRTVDAAAIATGLQLILLGCVRKIAIADAVAPYVNEIFSNPAGQTSLRLLLGLYLFALQIYGDFAGYSDIARGVSRLFGIELMVNFRQPYFSADITEFWRRWHVSLSTWLRDYLYIPLGGNRKGARRTYINLMATMLLGGLWHGAAWTFVIWGGLHGVFLAIHKRFGRGKSPELGAPAEATPLGWAWFTVKVLVTFHLVCLAWLFFRAESMEQVWVYLGGMAHCTLACDLRTLVVAAFYLSLMLVIDCPCWAFDRETPLGAGTPWYVRGTAQAAALALIAFVGASDVRQFIYFQF